MLIATRRALLLGLLASLTPMVGCGGASDSQAPKIRFVFITSVGYPGDLGGLVGADSLCTVHASAAGHAGTWKAWLSDEATNAIDRIAGVGPWTLMGTTSVVAQTPASFALSPSGTINRTENGALIGTPFNFWSGTATGGAKVAGATCSSWTTSTSGVGRDHQQNGGPIPWFSAANDTCNARLFLACIEQ